VKLKNSFLVEKSFDIFNSYANLPFVILRGLPCLGSKHLLADVGPWFRNVSNADQIC